MKTPRIHTDRHGNRLVIFSKRRGTADHPVIAWYLDSLAITAVLTSITATAVIISLTTR